MGYLALATGTQPRYWAVVFPAVLGDSTAVGLLVTSLSAAVVSEVTPARLASGTSISVTAHAAGAVVSLSVLALILSAVRGGTATPVAYHVAWTAMAAVAVTAVAAACGLRSRGEPPVS